MVNFDQLHLYLYMSSSIMSLISSLLIIVLYRVLNPRNIIYKYIFLLAIVDLLLSFFNSLDASLALSKDQIRTFEFCQIVGVMKITTGMSTWCWTAVIAWHCQSPKEKIERKVFLFSFGYPALMGLIFGSMQQMSSSPDYLYNLYQSTLMCLGVGCITSI